MYAIFAIVLQKLVQWTLDNVHWKTFNRPIWFSGRWFLSSWYFQFTLRYSPLSLWYFQYWKSIWKQHDNDCLPLLKWDVKPLSHCCLSCLRSFNQFSKTRLADFIQPKNCEISNSGGNIFCKIECFWQIASSGWVFWVVSATNVWKHLLSCPHLENYELPM